MVYGYIRVSTDKQEVEGQKIGIIEKATSLGLEINTWISDDGISGTKEPEERQLGKLLKKIKPKDVIIASEISRLGRSLFMVMRILEHCMKHECQVYTVKDGYELGNNIQSKVMAFAFGLAAEIERDMISKRTKEGLAKRKSDGVVLGRPLGNKSKSTKCDPLKAKIQSFLNKKLSYSAIGRLLKINRLTISKYCIDNNMVEKVVKPKKKEKNLNLDIMFEDKVILSIYKKEFSIISIAKHYDCTQHAIQGYLKRNPDLKIKMQEIADKQRENNPPKPKY